MPKEEDMRYVVSTIVLVLLIVGVAGASGTGSNNPFAPPMPAEISPPRVQEQPAQGTVPSEAPITTGTQPEGRIVRTGSAVVRMNGDGSFEYIVRPTSTDRPDEVTSVRPPGQAPTDAELIQNAGFETGSLPPWYQGANWTVVTTSPHSGTYCARGYQNNWVRQDFSATPGTSIQSITLWLRQPSAAISAIDLWYSDGTFYEQTVSVPTAWTQFDVTSWLNPSKSLNGIRVYSYSGSGTQETFLDDVSIQTGSQYKVMVASTDPSSYMQALANRLRDSSGGAFSAVDYYDLAGNATFPATQWYNAGYRALLIYSGDPYMNNGVAAGDSAARFVELGGGVVNAVWADNAGLNLQGKYRDRYMAFTTQQCLFTNASLGTVHNPGHPITSGVTALATTSLYTGNTHSTLRGSYSTCIAEFNPSPYCLVATFDSGGKRTASIGYLPTGNENGYPLTGHHVRILVNALKWTAQAGFKVMIAHSYTPAWIPTLMRYLRDSCGGAFSSVDTYDFAGARPPFPATQWYNNGYRAILTFTDYSWTNKGPIGDSLAKFIELGGGVVSGTAAEVGGWEIQGRYRDAYEPFTVGSNANSSSGAYMSLVHNPGHPIMAGVASCSTTYWMTNRAHSNLRSSNCVCLAEWNISNRVVVAYFDSSGRRAVSLGFYPDSCITSSLMHGQWVRLVVNALKWTVPGSGVTNDVGCTRILAPAGTLDSGTVVAPACSVYNYGTTTPGSYTVRMKIGASYNNTASLSGPAPGARAYVTFPTAWIAGPRGSSAVTCSTELSGDATPTNDKQTGAVAVNVTDVGVARILSPLALLDGTVDSGATVTPACSVYNYGTTTPGSYTVRMKIGATYDNTATLSGPAPGAKAYLIFPVWTALPRGNLAVSCSTELAADQVTANDKLTGSVFVAVHDVGVVAIVVPPASGPPGWVTPEATLHNYGTAREGLNVTFSISPTPYLVTVPLPVGIPVGIDTNITFTAWNGTPGTYTALCSTYLATDQVQANDKLSKPFSVGTIDVGVLKLAAPAGALDTSAAITPSAWVKNYGSIAATFKAYFLIDKGATALPAGLCSEGKESEGADAVVYSESADVSGLAGGDSVIPVFPEWAKPHAVGSYTTRCSTYLAGDETHGNDALGGSFTITAPSTDTGWGQKADVPTGPKSKRVKDGGSLAYTEEGTGGQGSGAGDDPVGYIYALKGNNRCEFYQYNTSANTWAAKESLPPIGRAGKKKAVKKGAALVAAEGKLYATKGNNTLEFWEYDPNATDAYKWTQKADVPTGVKNVKEGAGLAAAKIGDTMYVYLLKGSSTQEFYRFNTMTNTWVAMPSAPSGLSGKPFKNGTCMEANPLPSPFADAAGALYALKGSYNEFFAYDLTANSWATKTALPLIGASGRKKKVKDGAGLASHGTTLYALKGGNTQEFWSYQSDSDRWVQKQDIPLGGGKRVKGGGALTYAVLPHALYALKGNNTLEFYRYGLSGKCEVGSMNYEVQSSSLIPHNSDFRLQIAPNPFSGAATITYSLPQAGNVALKLYDVTGTLKATLTSGYHNAGASSFILHPSSLSKGIYLLKLETETTTTTEKLIIE
jgi:hypothetical protein